jgi:hypothetical protein
MENQCESRYRAEYYKRESYIQQGRRWSTHPGGCSLPARRHHLDRRSTQRYETGRSDNMVERLSVGERYIVSTIATDT